MKKDPDRIVQEFWKALYRTVELAQRDRGKKHFLSEGGFIKTIATVLQ